MKKRSGRWIGNKCVESGEHIQAKERLARWLKNVGCDVVVEYPFTRSGGGLQDWRRFGRKPTRRMVKALYICDLVIITDGCASHAIEIVKSSPPSEEKVAWLKANGLEVYWVWSSDVVGFAKQPDDIDPIMHRIDW